MASKKDDPRLNWICEDCGEVHVGEDPPDECKRCAFGYFENLADLQAEANKLARQPGVTLH